MTFGVDYAWGRPGIGALKTAGVRFAARYLSHDSTGKNLDRAEAEQLSAAGIWILVVWESTANRALDGYDAGAQDARDAEAQARACGMPPGRPVFFACDFDAGPGDRAAINAYLDGAASVLGKGRVGLYGGYYPIKWAFDGGHITWGWQTYAWSGGQWDHRAQLHQYSNDHIIGGVGLDFDTALTGDYGQWQVGASPSPGPQPQPQSQPEDDMRGNLDKGPLAVTSLSWELGAAKVGIGFFCDTGLLESGPIDLRVAYNLAPDAQGNVAYHLEKKVTLDSSKRKPVVLFGADAAHIESVSVQRLNGTGDESIGWDAS